MSDVTVTKIEYLDERDVFDLQVDGDHSYVANGLMSHNSVFANVISLYQASIGLRVSLTSLEMNRDHVTRRALAKITNTPLSLINRPGSLSNSQKNDILRKWVEFHKKVRRNGGRWTVITPTEDVSIEDILTLLGPYGYDNNVIDYVGLLKGADGEEQWRRLGAIVRFASRNASANNTVNTLMAQLSSAGELRYSRTMQEHAALMWQWQWDDKSSDSGILNVKQPKARQLESFDFHLAAKYATMNITDIDPEELNERRSKRGRDEEETPSRDSRNNREKYKRSSRRESSDEGTSPYQL